MHASREDYQAFHRYRRDALLDLVGRHLTAKAARALDVGGGGDVSGHAQALLERHCGELHSLDQGGDVEAGQRRGVQSTACDVDREAFPFPGNHFGLTIFASVIEHLYNPHHVLDEIARVLAPGGLLILEAPNAVSLGRRLDALAGRNPFRWFNQYNALERKAPMEYCSVFYTAEEAAALLDGRFTILETRYAMHNPPANPLKQGLRRAVAAIRPRLSDCFFIAAARADD